MSGRPPAYPTQPGYNPGYNPGAPVSGPGYPPAPGYPQQVRHQLSDHYDGVRAGPAPRWLLLPPRGGPGVRAPARARRGGPAAAAPSCRQ